MYSALRMFCVIVLNNLLIYLLPSLPIVGANNRLRLPCTLQGVAKYADFKMFEDEGLNTTDVDASLQQLKDNDAKLKELNLNNIKVEMCAREKLLAELAADATACTACLLRMQQRHAALLMA